MTSELSQTTGTYLDSQTTGTYLDIPIEFQMTPGEREFDNRRSDSMK